MKAYCKKVRNEQEEEYYQLGRKAGVKEGRRQIIANLSGHYDAMYFSLPRSYAPDCEIGVCLPESTLHQYFKELKQRRGKEVSI